MNSGTKSKPKSLKKMEKDKVCTPNVKQPKALETTATGKDNDGNKQHETSAPAGLPKEQGQPGLFCVSGAKIPATVLQTRWESHRRTSTRVEWTQRRYPSTDLQLKGLIPAPSRYWGTRWRGKPCQQVNNAWMVPDWTEMLEKSFHLIRRRSLPWATAAMQKKFISMFWIEDKSTTFLNNCCPKKSPIWIRKISLTVLLKGVKGTRSRLSAA